METSKVLVTYSDPSGVYDSIAETFQKQLPLRNLHWNSPSRPLRSITALHVDLVSDIKPSSRPPSTGSPFATAPEGFNSKCDGPKPERRHQFPGLQQSSYLKIYFLTCPDVDAYKATSRKELREWVKGHAPQSQSSTSVNKQDNHNAFEWLIVHLVTSSAEGSNASRSTSITKGDGDNGKRPTTSRWPSRGSTSSVIEKIRSDFNGTSKNAVDRVVQLPTDEAKDAPGISKRDFQSNNSGWEDLISKMKALILASFDRRVSQYEEDIKEKDLQRNLPGWNFNTFFVLKEGLARGFESVGLIEDSLADYRELAAGLNAVVDEQTGHDASDQHTAHFSGYTTEICNEYKEAISPDQEPSQGKSVDDLGASILNTNRKDYRYLILSNNISVFEFQCYVFARQVTLLLRLANATIEHSVRANSSNSDGTSNKDSSASIANARLSKPGDGEPENLLILGEICQLASEFIASASRTMREDIKISIHGEAAADGQPITPNDEIIDNLVASWTLSASQTLLEATTAKSLSLQLDPLLRQLKPRANSDANSNSEKAVDSPKSMHRESLPDQSTSPRSPVPSLTISQPRDKFPSVTSLDAVRLLPPGTSHPGAPELAAQRGDLLSLSRRVLSSRGDRNKGWHAGLADAAMGHELQDHELQNIDLEDSNSETAVVGNPPVRAEAPTSRGVRNTMLLSALQSESESHKAYESLTVLALAHYVVGKRKNAAESLTADLAVIRFYLKDHESAASYFGQLAEFYRKNDWKPLEMAMLDMHAKCLRHLGRTKEFIEIALKTLGTKKYDSNALGKPTYPFKDLVTASNLLKQQVVIPLKGYFDNIELDSYIEHYSECDGFHSTLRLRSLLPESFQADSIQVKIVSIGEQQSCEILLDANIGQEIVPGINRILVGTKTMHPAWFTLSDVTIRVQNMLFAPGPSLKPETLFFPKSRDSTSLDHNKMTERKRILVWAQPRSLEVKMSHYDSIDLQRPRSLKVEIFSGHNEVSEGSLSMRAASAGLRLETAGATEDDDNANITNKAQPGALSFDKIPADSSVRFSVPYSLESHLKEIAVKVELSYTTDKGEFIYSSNYKIDVVLPLAVNVQDIFKRDALFSKFSIGSATSTPLRISKCYIDGNDDFEATSPVLNDAEIDIFPRQPLSFILRLRRRPQEHVRNPQADGSTTRRHLFLRIEYRCLDQEINAVIEAKLSDSLASTPLHVFARILRSNLVAGLRSKFSTADLESIGMLREVDLGAYEQQHWDSVLKGFSPNIRTELEGFLRRWHTETKTIALDADTNLTPMQHLTVPFDLPQMQVVHTAYLHLLSDAYNAEFSSIALGQALPVRLVIKHTRQWGLESKPAIANQRLDFSFEIQADPDTWLVGGQRKARFSAKEGESVSFNLILLPQSTGHLPYPSLEIYHLGVADSTEPVVPAESTIPCETDYLNQGETVHVVPDLTSTTISLDPGSGAWLLGSKSRQS